MMRLGPTLVACSALIVFLLGVIHLVYTFRGTKLHPRDAGLEEGMKAVSPVLTRQTTMWKAWIGFNASHGFGAILFGLIFTYLPMHHPAFFFHSWFLPTVGFVFLAGYVFLGSRYWFSVPYRCTLVSVVLYLAGLVMVWGQI